MTVGREQVLYNAGFSHDTAEVLRKRIGEGEEAWSLFLMHVAREVALAPFNISDIDVYARQALMDKMGLAVVDTYLENPEKWDAISLEKHTVVEAA